MRIGDEATERVAGLPVPAARRGGRRGVPRSRGRVPRPARPARVERLLFELAPGVTEISLHPGVDTDELRAACGDWSGRVEDYAYLTRDPSLLDLARARAT